MSQIDPRVSTAVRGALGPLYDELLQVLVDLAVPPIFLMADDRPRLVEVRERAANELRSWATERPVEAAALVDLLPRSMQLPDVVASLLESAPWDDYFQLPNSVFELPDPTARVFAALPKLLERVDDDGLLDVEGFDARPHGIFVDSFSLHYHQLLRRGFSSSVHYELMGIVLGLARRGDGIRARVAIDERRLRRRDEHEEFEERDYWYGPRLEEADLDDVTVVGESVHGDPECGQSLFCPYWATSFRWTRDTAGYKTVEVEEFLPLHEGGVGPVLARYLHAIRDTAKAQFVHCDGAVKVYDRATYPTDLDGFHRRGKGLHYRKVFRLDGPMSASDWSHLTALWFRGNPLVLEYLNGLAGSDSAT